MRDSSSITQTVETQGITVQKDSAGLTQLRKLQVDVNMLEDSMDSPLMILRSEKNNRRFEFHYKGKRVLSLEPDGSIRLDVPSAEVYDAFRIWVEKSVGL